MNAMPENPRHEDCCGILRARKAWTDLDPDQAAIDAALAAIWRSVMPPPKPFSFQSRYGNRPDWSDCSKKRG